MDAVSAEVVRMQMWRQLSMAVLVVAVTGAGAPAYADPAPLPQQAPAQASAQFLLTGQIAPVTLRVDPHPEPVNPGQQVTLRGTLHGASDNAPLGERNLYLSAPNGDLIEFGATDEAGAWQITFAVPAQAGQTDTFPRYPLTVHFDGDLIVGAAEQPIELTLATAQAPATPTPTPSASPTYQSPPPTSGTEQPTAYPTQSGSGFLPLTPGQLMIGGGIVVTVFGAALLSHGIRRRQG